LKKCLENKIKLHLYSTEIYVVILDQLVISPKKEISHSEKFSISCKY